MAEEPFALSTVAPRSEDESDYEAICVTVMESARGRWFLEEYARRNRQADTAVVLTAIERLENLIQLERAAQGSLAFRTVLLEMAGTISEARGQTIALDAPEEPARPSNQRSSSRGEILATAERLQDVAWTMRERGIDAATCQEIETLASSILTLPQPFPPPPQVGQEKLRAVLQYLEQRIRSMLDACPPAPAPAAGADAQNKTGLPVSLAETDVVTASETVPIECVVADQQIPGPAVANPGMPEPISESIQEDLESLQEDSEAGDLDTHGAVEIASSIGTTSGAESEHAAASLTDVPPSLEEHAEHAFTQSMAELELEPLLPKAAQEKEMWTQPLLDVPPLTVEPLSQSPESFEESFSHALSALTQILRPSPPTTTELVPEQIEPAVLPLMQHVPPVDTPDGGVEMTQSRSDLEIEAPAVERVPVKLMQDRAAVAPSSRLRGEGGGEGPTASIVVFAPHPTPLPVKNGEREQTDRAPSCDATSPEHALKGDDDSKKNHSTLVVTDESINACAEEKAPAELSTIRSEHPESIIEQVSSHAADLDSRCEDIAVDVAAAQYELVERRPSPCPDSEIEITPANASNFAPGEDNAPVAAAPGSDTLDDSPAQTCLRDAHVYLEHTRMELGLIEGAAQTAFVSESSDASNLACSGEEKSADALQAVSDMIPAVSTPEIAPCALPPAETVDLSKQAEDASTRTLPRVHGREGWEESAGDTEVSPQQCAPPIEALTGHSEDLSATIQSDRPDAPTLEEDIPIRTEELAETLVASLSIETRTECLPDEIVSSESASENVLAQCSPVACDDAIISVSEAIISVNEEAPDSIEAGELEAETALQSNRRLPVSTISPHEQGGQDVISNEPTVTIAAASISGNEVLVLAPDDNAPVAAEARFEEGVQPKDETLVQTAKESSDLEQTEHEAAAIAADAAIAAEVAHAAAIEETASQADEAHPQPRDAVQQEAALAGRTDLPLPESEIGLPAVTPIASVSEHEEKGGAEGVDLPTPPPQVPSTVIAHDDVLSGAWEEAVLHPEAESAHQARLTGAKPPYAKANGDLCATESETELPLVTREVVETARTSADSSLDPIDEIEQELFAPSSIVSAPVPESEPPRARPTEELLPQPTLTETAPAPPVTPIETVSAPSPVMAPVLEKPSASPTRPIVRSMPRPAPTDPLAALRAMTDEERIALFS
jgi:hypothetical protein